MTWLGWIGVAWLVCAAIVLGMMVLATRTSKSDAPKDEVRGNHWRDR